MYCGNTSIRPPVAIRSGIVELTVGWSVVPGTQEIERKVSELVGLGWRAKVTPLLNQLLRVKHLTIIGKSSKM